MTMLSVFLAKAINFYSASFHPREWIFLPYLNFWFHTWGWFFCFCQIQVCLLQPVGKVFWVSKICWCLKLSYFTSKVMWFKLLYIVEKEFPPHKVKITPHITDSLITTKWLVYNSSVFCHHSALLVSCCTIPSMILVQSSRWYLRYGEKPSQY